MWIAPGGAVEGGWKFVKSHVHLCVRGEEVKSLCPLGVPQPGYVYTALKLVAYSEMCPS